MIIDSNNPDQIDEVIAGIKKLPYDPEFLYIDLFCGGGGTTTGIDQAEVNGQKVAIVIAAINHDFTAIESHWKNHPHVVHFNEDIKTLNLGPLTRLLEHYRLLYPNAKIKLWASLECTNFSNAKGGQTRDADSRTLAEHLYRYIQALQPDYIQIENVVEFMSWGPLIAKVLKTKDGCQYCEVSYVRTMVPILDKNGVPLLNKKSGKPRMVKKGPYQAVAKMVPESRKNGIDWLRWRGFIKAFGYRDDWREINSADLGAYTSRNRLFGCFAKPGLPIAWPVATHAKKPVADGLFPGLKKWMAVKEVLDFGDQGRSIFTRDVALVDNSLRRILAGLKKYVPEGEAFMMASNGGDPNSKVFSINGPCRTLLASNNKSVVFPAFMAKYFSGKPESMVAPVDGPCGALRCKDGTSLVFLTARHGGEPKGHVFDAEGPCRTLTSVPTISTVFLTTSYGGDPKKQVFSPESPCRTMPARSTVGMVFLTKYYGATGQTSSADDPAGTLGTRDTMATIWLDKHFSGANNHQSVEVPAGSILTKDKYSVVQASWIDRQFSQGTKDSSIEDPIGALMPVPKANLVQTCPFVMPTHYSNTPTSIEDPATAITADGHYHYLVNPSFYGHSYGIDQPSPVLIARQDKAPLYLVSVAPGHPCMPIYEDDTEVMLQIKIFCLLYDIADIRMRMLKISEMKPIQGLSKDYILMGSQEKQKKAIGNMVHPLVAEKWVLAMQAALTA